MKFMQIIKNPYGLKPWFTRTLGGFVRWADRKNISPDLFTLIGVLGAAVGAAVLALPAFGVYLSTLPAVSLVFLFGFVVRLGGANLDGAVARARGVSRPGGFILNELGDRVSDFLLFAGLYLAVAEPWKFMVLIVAFISSIPTLVSVSGAAVGATRINGGPYGKTERTLAFVVLAGLTVNQETEPANWFIAALLGLMAIGAIATSVSRYEKIHEYLDENGTDWQDDQPTVIQGSS